MSSQELLNNSHSQHIGIEQVGFSPSTYRGDQKFQPADIEWTKQKTLQISNELGRDAYLGSEGLPEMPRQILTTTRNNHGTSITLRAYPLNGNLAGHVFVENWTGGLPRPENAKVTSPDAIAIFNLSDNDLNKQERKTLINTAFKCLNRYRNQEGEILFSSLQQTALEFVKVLSQLDPEPLVMTNVSGPDAILGAVQYASQNAVEKLRIPCPIKIRDSWVPLDGSTVGEQNILLTARCKEAAGVCAGLKEVKIIKGTPDNSKKSLQSQGKWFELTFRREDNGLYAIMHSARQHSTKLGSNYDKQNGAKTEVRANIHSCGDKPRYQSENIISLVEAFISDHQSDGLWSDSIAMNELRELCKKTQMQTTRGHTVSDLRIYNGRIEGVNWHGLNIQEGALVNSIFIDCEIDFEADAANIIDCQFKNCRTHFRGIHGPAAGVVIKGGSWDSNSVLTGGFEGSVVQDCKFSANTSELYPSDISIEKQRSRWGFARK